MEQLVSKMRDRVKEFNPAEDYQAEQNLYEAFIAFAEEYKRFDGDKNYQNWKRAKDASNAVIEIASHDKLLTPTMSVIWRRSKEFDDIVQDKWMYSELDRLKAPAHERHFPHSYLESRYERSLDDKPEPDDPGKAGTRNNENDKAKASARAVLGLPDNATASEIRNAYYKKSKEYHPDRHPGEESKYTELQQSVVGAHGALVDDAKGGGKKRHNAAQVKRRAPVASTKSKSKSKPKKRSKKYKKSRNTKKTKKTKNTKNTKNTKKTKNTKNAKNAKK